MASGYAWGCARGSDVVQSPSLVSGRALGKPDVVVKMQLLIAIFLLQVECWEPACSRSDWQYLRKKLVRAPGLTVLLPGCS